MENTRLDTWIREQIDAFPGKASLLMTDLLNGEHYHSIDPEEPFPASSAIKVPLLIFVLELVRQDRLELDREIPLPPERAGEDSRVAEMGDSVYTLRELLYWMIAEDDDLAADLVLALVDTDEMEEYLSSTMGLKATDCRRPLRDSRTTAQDQERVWWAVYRGTVLDHDLRELALDILHRHRRSGLFLRYVPNPVGLSHMSGVEEGACCDSGIFEAFPAPFYLGIFTWDGPAGDGKEQEKFIGRLAREIYERYV